MQSQSFCREFLPIINRPSGSTFFKSATNDIRLDFSWNNSIIRTLTCWRLSQENTRSSIKPGCLLSSYNETSFIPILHFSAWLDKQAFGRKISIEITSAMNFEGFRDLNFGFQWFTQHISKTHFIIKKWHIVPLKNYH